MAQPYVTENNEQRARLRALVERASDADLARPLEAGWTVGAVLAHLAFWDQRTLLLIERWEKEGPRTPPRGIEGKDVDWINDSAKALCLALPPRAAARLAVATAEAVDRRGEGLASGPVRADAGTGPALHPVLA